MARQSRKKDRNLIRRPQIREAYDKVLIVCEGEKTEPFYFQGLIKAEKLSSVNVQVDHVGSRSAPIHVIDRAIELTMEANKDANSEAHYDRVYCVIDRDEHSTFNQAIQKISTANKQANSALYYGVVSYPSFEYWYICHFERNRGSMSSAVCERNANSLWQNTFHEPYQKNNSEAYSKLRSKQADAISNAKFAIKDADETDQKNPSTNVHELVEYLIGLKHSAARRS
ncbi:MULTISPECIES: RloB family protein [unclassified Moraxella]|uniref:RloB family protein n=1 Tax=unclassified Moraxella TaxID=2685852 RepID=UPI00359E52EA